MAQGKFKAKNKLPAGAKTKNKAKGGAITKRKAAPAKSKSGVESNKMKQAVTKMVNKAAEKQLRARATEGPKQLTDAQKRVAAAPTAPSKSK